MPIELTDYEIDQEGKAEIDEHLYYEHISEQKGLIYKAIDGLKVAGKTDNEIRAIISEIVEDQLF